ncbi:3'-5' exoribonuclease, partial [Escherichia coli]
KRVFLVILFTSFSGSLVSRISGAVQWLQQSSEARTAILTDKIPMEDALLQFMEFIDENSGEFFVQVWGNGAN